MRVQGVQGQGCPQHESTQPRALTLLPHKTRVRHKKQAQVQTVSKRVESLGVRVEGATYRGGVQGFAGNTKKAENEGVTGGSRGSRRVWGGSTESQGGSGHSG